MKFTDFVKELGYEISFVGISEPRKENVMLRIIVNRSKDITDLLIFPHQDSKVTSLQIDFPHYIAYSVVYDDYTIWNEEETFQVDSFRIYEKSGYLEYVKKAYCLKNINVKHYSLACFEHHVNIITEAEPIITEIIL